LILLLTPIGLCKKSVKSEGVFTSKRLPNLSGKTREKGSPTLGLEIASKRFCGCFEAPDSERQQADTMLGNSCKAEKSIPHGNRVRVSLPMDLELILE
jgi:hypothetical protein